MAHERFCPKESIYFRGDIFEELNSSLITLTLSLLIPPPDHFLKGCPDGRKRCLRPKGCLPSASTYICHSVPSRALSTLPKHSFNPHHTHFTSEKTEA